MLCFRYGYCSLHAVFYLNFKRLSKKVSNDFFDVSFSVQIKRKRTHTRSIAADTNAALISPSNTSHMKKNKSVQCSPVRFSNRSVHPRAIPKCWPAAVLHACMPRAICANTVAAYKTRWAKRRALRCQPYTMAVALHQIRIHSTNRNYSKTMGLHPSAIRISNRT